MANNDNDRHQLLNSYNSGGGGGGGGGGLSQDAHGRWWEILSPTQVLTGGRGGEQQQQKIVKRKKKKCHGNTKLQHFKRKCRARGLTKDEITRLIRERNQKTYERLANDETTNHELVKESNKRRKDEHQPNAVAAAELVDSSTKSLSQLFISQEKQRTGNEEEEEEEEEEVKRMKKNSSYESMSYSFSNNDNDGNNNYYYYNRNELRNEDNNCTLYELSKYLRMPRRLLLHSLQLQLNSCCNSRLKRRWKKKERCFLLKRLELFDRQFYLDQIRYLYQFYFEQGLKYQIWPVSFSRHSILV